MIDEGDLAARGYPKGRRKRAEIVSAALHAFAVDGYRSASMTQLAAACGVSRAGLAHHFPTKESLLIAVLTERDRVNGELFFTGADGGADGLDYFRRLVRVIAHNVSVPGVIGLYPTLSTEAADPAHPAHDYFVDRFRWLRRDIRAALVDVTARGLVHDGLDLDDVASDIIALIDGLQVQWLMEPATTDMAARLESWLEQTLGLRL